MSTTANNPLDQPIVAMYRTPLDIYSSQSSMYSADGGQADYSISGSVLLGIWHTNDTLSVRVVMAKNLAGAKAGGLSDPYVKTYLLPDHSKLTKRKTAIQRKTNDPTYNEVLKNKLPRIDVSQTTLWLSVWDWERFGRNLFLGEIRLHLSSLDLTNSDNRWYRLQGKKPEPVSEERGKLLVSIKYSPYRDQEKGSLFIQIKEANNLPQMNPQGLADSAVRVFLLPKQNPFTKKKTKCINNTLDPVWNEEFEYKYVTDEELKSTRVLELSVWDYDRRGCNDFIGCVRLGPAPDETNSISRDWMDSTDSEASHWADMLARPGEWVEACHELRPSIASRFFEYPSIDEEKDIGLESDGGDSDEEQHDSDGSSVSLYSESETRGDHPITGKLQVRLEYKETNLTVHVLRAEGLAAADSNGYSDPYVKLLLLPDKTKSTKRKTKVKRKTLNPVFNETVKYPVKEPQLSSHTLFFSVWDWDRFGKNEFLGEVRVPLSDSNVNGPSRWYGLSDNMDVGDDNSISETAPSNGKLTIGLKFEELAFKKGEVYGDLHVYIRNAKDLPNKDVRGYTDGFVKIFLLPSKSSKMQRKTKVVKDDLNPTWNETFVYKKVTEEHLSSRCALEVSVWDHDVLSSNDFVGGLRIGPAPTPGLANGWMDSTEFEAKHWEEMLSRPGEWVEHCHVLRPSMKYRDITNPEQSATPEAPVNTEKKEAITEPTGAVKKKEQASGQLVVSAMFEVVGKEDRTTGTLHVTVKEAEQLQCKATSAIFAKCCMLPQEMFSSKNKTKTIKNTANPVWDHSCVFDKQFLDEIVAEQVLEITLWDSNDESMLIFVGGVRLGPDPAANSTRYSWMDSSGDEVKHWEAIFTKPGEWVEFKHNLRPAMNC